MERMEFSTSFFNFSAETGGTPTHIYHSIFMAEQDTQKPASIFVEDSRLESMKKRDFNPFRLAQTTTSFVS